MKRIPLTKGKFALVDDEDYEQLSKLKWRYNPLGYARFAGSWTLMIRPQFMHTMIMKPPKGKVVDHINQDKLDNRRSNLRVCTRSVNCRNIRLRATNKSGYRGVSIDKRYAHTKTPWIVRPRLEGKFIMLGHFATPEEASKAYEAFVEVHS